ncbi:MAG TPA: hypothetical protein DHW61_06130 [Lachnoclostridium phytofermentans]|uniref:DUF4129 domain-containing protein n=1 Tax=Lachnoclostridium phytofermentans TaxID=66219 RepID=A0A3D2X5Z9_9FIRM|nr:hypothetical protein [Lachnoclostridium sp.]HCL01985.1 hypothetical protein [Lachnoclostridium phytofermentans]
MKPRYQKLLDVFHLGMLLLVCCTLTTLLFQFVKQTSIVRQSAFYAILLIFSYLINSYVRKHFFIFLLPHLVILVMLFYLTIPTMDKTLCIILWSFLIGFDILFWCDMTRSKVIDMPLPLIFAYPVLYWYLGRSDIGNYQTLSYYFGILYLMLALLCSYLKNTKYIEPIKEDTGYTPTKEILKSNNRMVFSICGTLLIGTFFLRYKPIEAFLSHALTLIKLGLRAILSFVVNLFHSASVIPEIEDMDLPDMQQAPLPEATASPISNLLLDVIIFIICFALVTGFIITVSVVIYRFIKKYLYPHTPASFTDGDDFSVIVTTERLIRKKLKTEVVDLKGNNNQKIRYYYKKRINRFIDKNKGFDPSLTPNERADTSDPISEKGLTELTAFYNRARYSNESLKKEDAKKAKTYL